MAVLVVTIALCAAGTTSASAAVTGSVRAWGNNAYGQLGHGKVVTNSNSPVQVVKLHRVSAIAAGGSHGLALLRGGTVKAWGDNSSGQLGNASNSNEDMPVAVTGLARVKSIAAGGTFSLALLSDGTVRAWGDNTHGELGDGSDVTYSNTPVVVTGLSGVTAIAAGVNHALALLSDGTVMAWGDNTDGELGDGSSGSFSTVPAIVSGLSGVTAIAAGNAFSEALVSGDVMTWGDNTSGQLGDGSTSNSDTPVPIVGLSSVTALVAGGSFGVAVESGGNAVAWGDNFYGELGNGTNTNSDVPVPVSGLSRVTSVSAGGAHALAVLNTGSVMAWGDNFYGELGTRSASTDSTLPVAVRLPRTATSVSAGDPGGNQGFSMALLANRTVKTWGYDAFGQLGNGAVRVNVGHPVNIHGLTGVTAVAAGSAFSLALMGDGTVDAWGINSVGQLGNGTTGNDSAAPVSVHGLGGVTSIAAGFEHGLALLSDGTVMAWGDNSQGELGNGTITSSDTPVAVSGLSGVTAVAAGGDFSLALLSNGTVMAWGDNSYGELGDGTTTSSDTPVAVSGLSDVTSVAAGLEHALALGSSGSISAWGNDNVGQLGDGEAGGISDTPVAVTGLTGSPVTAVSAGLDHSLALHSDGTVAAWGDNSSGELGNASTTNSDVPVAVENLTGVAAISAGSNFSLALSAANGHIYSFGLDAGTQTDIPVVVPRIGGIAKISAGANHSLAVTGPRPPAPSIRQRQRGTAGKAGAGHPVNARLTRSAVSREGRSSHARAGRDYAPTARR